MTESTTVTADPEVVSLINTICADLAQTAQVPQDGSLNQDAWETLSQSGLLSLTDTNDPQSLAHAATLAEAIAHHRLAIPSGEHDIMSKWVGQTVGLDLDATALVITTEVDRDGRSTRVPWARHAQTFVALSRTGEGLGISVVTSDDVEITPGLNHAGDARDAIKIDPAALASAERVDPTLGDALRVRGAYLRAAQIVGAMNAAVEASLQYASEREQFGRPIAKFPLVQRMLVESVNESQLGAAAVDHATLVVADPQATDSDKTMAVAIARSVVAHAAGAVTRHAHQVHGAIGTTAEHPLHFSTQAMEAWASEFGSTAHWESLISEHLRATTQPVWDLIS